MKPILTPANSTNFITHQQLFYEIVMSLDAINCSHIALYQSLFRFWNLNYFNNPFQGQRDLLMSASGIRSKSVYYKVIRELETFDLIRYYPSNSIYSKSFFCISTLQKVNEDINISVWGISNHHDLNGIGQTSTEQKSSDLKDKNNLRVLTTLINGKGKLILLKEYPLFINDVSNDALNTSTQPIFNPLTDPRYTSQIDNRISSPSNNSNYANYQNSQSGRSGLRPPGVQIDPDADYSIRL